MNCHCQVIILEVMGEYRAYLVRDVSLKNMSWKFNVVKGAQDITKLVLNVGMNFHQGMTERALEEQTQSISKEEFTFETDNYLLLSKVDINRG